MQHSFDVDIATEYGVNCAILLNHIWFWCEKNRANEKHNIDGKYWTYNSVRAFEELFPYMGAKAIRNALKKLEDEGLVESGCFNEEVYDRTKWYAITPKGYTHLSKGQMTFTQKGEPIPDINTDRDIINKLNNKEDYKYNNISYAQKHKEEVETLFEQLWKLYPRKLGKSSISKTAKERLFKVGEEEMIRCIERYKKDVEGRDMEYILYGSSFFNKGYESYLDKNYAEYTGQSELQEQKVSGDNSWQ